MGDFEIQTNPESQAKPAAGALPAAAPTTELQDCWNKIGVYGQGTCPELERHIHCRNCPVYSRAGGLLLDRPLPEGYRQEWTRHFGKLKNLTTSGRTSALLFRLGPEWLALPTQAFQEVAERRLIHSLPHRRQGIVLGLANIRGELVICASLGRLLGIEKVQRKAARTVYDRLLVCNWEGKRLAFPVEEVFGIYRFETHQLQPVPATVAPGQSFSRGILLWQERAVGFLDADQLFSTLNRSLT